MGKLIRIGTGQRFIIQQNGDAANDNKNPNQGQTQVGESEFTQLAYVDHVEALDEILNRLYQVQSRKTQDKELLLETHFDVSLVFNSENCRREFAEVGQLLRREFYLISG